MNAVLIISDNERLCTEIRGHLASTKSSIKVASSLDGVASWLQDWPFSVVFCDLALPNDEGYALLSRLSFTVDSGLVAITARPGPEDRALAMRLGADNVLMHPFTGEELVAMVSNLFRRASGRQGVDTPGMKPSAQVDAEQSQGWQLDLMNWRLVSPHKQDARLSFPEYCIVRELAESPGQVVARDYLVNVLSNNGVRIYGRNIDMMMSRLRRKVQKNCTEPLPVQSVRGIGYVFSGRIELLK